MFKVLLVIASIVVLVVLCMLALLSVNLWRIVKSRKEDNKNRLVVSIKKSNLLFKQIK